VRGDPRARRTSPEGAFSPRARRTSPEGAFSRAALAGRGGHQGCDRLVCAFLGSWISSRFALFMSFKRVLPGYLGDPYGCPRQPPSLPTYVTRVRVRVSDTIRIRYADTHFVKRKSTKLVYPSIRIRVSDEYTSPPWSIRVT
jgi:hypothetical protein